jgi:hypothetical protein
MDELAYDPATEDSVMRAWFVAHWKAIAGAFITLPGAWSTESS